MNQTAGMRSCQNCGGAIFFGAGEANMTDSTDPRIEYIRKDLYDKLRADAEALVLALEECTAFSCTCDYWRVKCPQCYAGEALSKWRGEGE